ncbi:DegV family protein [Brochothrix campestris]|uniref:EDD, DegV family domain-containing protein n=1 Tax=Brochothrix campestris FSL F6-1037 TaxID=1265861 RepID=W7CII1_9LIST|nr:DegV family protein [Brochothrix campestris]EUJ36715.1 EDD, DegV family domain-containing protein [Brochothrix campestris FSL F6-1037]
MFNITSNDLLYAFQQGAQTVMQHTTELNDINVFPVADGDTGSNLASLMQAIVAMKQHPGETSAACAHRIGETAIKGARGNSGIIVAQYLNGLAAAIPPQPAIALATFAEAAQQATRSAYQAINNPTEGTMLSVMKQWGDRLQHGVQQEQSFGTALTNALNDAQLSVQATPQQLKTLKTNGVVDAGALGFYYFIKGVTTALLNPTSGPFKAADIRVIGTITPTEHPLTTAPIQRYCTELLVIDLTVSQAELKQLLSRFGDSLVVAMSQQSARIHLHTNTPAAVVAVVNQYGHISEQKVDDMVLQFMVKQHRQSPIALVTDSIADLPAEFVLNEQIQVLPMTLRLDDRSYLDKVTLTDQQFYANVNTTVKQSTQPPLALMIQRLERLKQDYNEVIMVSVSSQLSGTFSAMQRAAARVASADFKIAVLDSKQNSVGQGLIVMQLAEALKAGRNFETLIRLGEALIARTKIVVSVPSVAAMIQSGRLPSRLGKIAQRLHLQPLIGLTAAGAGKVQGITIGTKANERKLLRHLRRLQKESPLLRYAVVHANAPQRAAALAQRATTQLGIAPSYLENISAVIAMSAGEGCVAIAVTTT